MGLFDSIFGRGRQQQHAEEVAPGGLYPGGASAFVRDFAKINSFVGAKVGPVELEKIIRNSATRLALARQRGAHSAEIVEGIFKRGNGVLTRQDATRIYAYLAGEATALFVVEQSYPPEMVQDALHNMQALYAAGVEADCLPNGYGEFGLSATNPILAISPIDASEYLASLRMQGTPLQFKRGASVKSPVTPGQVDVYTPWMGTILVAGNLFVSPYQKTTSTIAPKHYGFA